jgi:hypothetical protein
VTSTETLTTAQLARAVAETATTQADPSKPADPATQPLGASAPADC